MEPVGLPEAEMEPVGLPEAVMEGVEVMEGVLETVELAVAETDWDAVRLGVALGVRLGLVVAEMLRVGETVDDAVGGKHTALGPPAPA
jgi:hypothetical protein